MPVLAIHAPCLLLTQRVWSTDPWTKLQRAQAAAERVGAPTVVVHPPFRWQRDYARDFVDGLHRMQDETDVTFAVENMFPWKARNREIAAYLPHWDLLELDFPATTLDLSHTAVVRLRRRCRWSRRWGTGCSTCTSPTAPGRTRTSTWCPAAADSRARTCWSGWPAAATPATVVLEVNTRRRAINRDEREADLAEGLAFARLNLAAAAGTPPREPVGVTVASSSTRSPPTTTPSGRTTRPSCSTRWSLRWDSRCCGRTCCDVGCRHRHRVAGARRPRAQR